MKAIIPPKLKAGDRVAIVAPSGSIGNIDAVKQAISVYESWGLKVVCGKYLFEKHGIWAGTDEQRAEDFQAALDSEEIKAIVCARGGYGASRIIDLLDFSMFQVQPKWIIGFSDITVFHSYINTHLDIATIHAAMPINYLNAHQDSIGSLRSLLFNDDLLYEFKADISKSFSCEAKLIGGNLSVLFAMQGTHFDLKAKNAVLLLEDLDEKVYHLDRMMQNLKLSGKLKQMKAFLFGGFTGMVPDSSPLGGGPEETLAMHAEQQPVVAGLPFGHIRRNIAIPLGRQLLFEADKAKGVLVIKK